jgi:ribosomal protein S18 acetylase RimI-like enzyme
VPLRRRGGSRCGELARRAAALSAARLGLALLRHAFGALYARGVRDVSLSVDADSTTGAPQLYTHAGMRPAKSFVRYEKELRPGEPLGE